MIIDRNGNNMEGLLICAYNMDQNTIDMIAKRFSIHIGEKVTFKVEVDPSLIGGFVASIRHHRYDYSIKYKLREMKKFLVDV